MSSHALIVRPAARLETIVLVIHSYVLLQSVHKTEWLSSYGCYFLIYVIRCTCSLDVSLTRNRTLFNLSFHGWTWIIVGIQPKYLISYNKYCRTYGYEKRPNDTVVPMGSSHIHLFNLINLDHSIIFNRIINNIRLFSNIPIYTVLDHNISK